MKKHYILLKESPELKEGAIMIEGCDDGTQDFYCKDRDFIKKDDCSNVMYRRKVIMEQPEWFEETKQLWLSLKEIANVRKFLKLK